MLGRGQGRGGRRQRNGRRSGRRGGSGSVPGRMAVPGHAAAVAMTAQVNLQHRRQPPRLAPTRPRATLAPMPSPHQCDFTLEPADNERLANLAGPFDAHLRQIELRLGVRSEEHTSELQSLLRISYAVFCLKKKTNQLTKYK